MKQILFLLLFPCFAMAQYQGNANQKITLGEQTTADGLVFRGVENDTTLITPRSDTSAYIILDTVNNRFYNYNRTTNVWSLAGGGVSVSSFSAGTTGLTPNTATTGAVTLDGTLAVANGGTGNSTLDAAGVVTKTGTQTISGEKSFSNANFILNNTNAAIVGGGTTAGRFFFNNSNFTSYLLINGSARTGAEHDITIVTNTSKIFHFNNDGNFGIGTGSPTEKLHIDDNARITAMNNVSDIGASSTGVLQAASVSDVNLKNTIENSSFGLNEILLLNPVTFFYNDLDRKMDNDVKDVGFIAQDVFDILPNAVSSTGTGDLQLDYRAITAALTKAIQEQQALIKALEQRILILENK